MEIKPSKSICEIVMLLKASGKTAKKAGKAQKNISKIVKKRKRKKKENIWLSMQSAHV